MTVATGLDVFLEEEALQQSVKGNVAYLCHNASADGRCREGLGLMQQLFGARLKAVFSPQHGLFSEAQDNMIESEHFRHPYSDIPVYSLYSETRIPTDEMLEGLQHVIIDLQDVGCRAYTFMYTMLLMMEACGRKGIEVIVLDRPNPINGITVEGNMLEEEYRSFIGRYAMPMRHGLTIGEVALMATRHWGVECTLRVIPLRGWRRRMHFGETKLPWVFPSPNMPHIKTAHVFPGLVLLEGTNLSEGRGTTRPFELFGHPGIQPHALLPKLKEPCRRYGLEGFVLRPLYFQPTFDKHEGTVCGGYQLHLTNRRVFRPWHSGQVLLRELRHALGDAFQWRQPPFEYEETLLPIDMLNGTDQLRHWVEEKGTWEELLDIEEKGKADYLEQRAEVLLYE